ncbi:phosphoglycerate mutase [Mangrovimicrobium sediminis]|uniref:Phosphoglycerate mutase n=1 Tax=Mangrovimicrobium sediminis TaxID=2562682 RepID=A0A4Z0M8L9_9GAMM|nr:histidine phosphatase family protein [Haliea sp. SAOS-164]TGD75736.1 phosphoglycerate mutase [Haliea sp. SAOS-164]
MKTLHLLRHAKSSQDESGLEDRERGLTARGEQDAPRMGAALADELEPMVIVVSAARRAQLTLEGLCAGWPGLGDLEHRTEGALYTFDGDNLQDWLRTQAGAGDSLFLIGHNPAFTDLINQLVGEKAIDNLPTAGYARLQLDIDDWPKLWPGCGTLERVIRPKEL